MTRSLPTLILLAAAAVLPAQAQEQRKSQTSGIEYYTTNFGVFGLNAAQNTGGFSYPRGTAGVPYLYGSGLWFGAGRRNDDERVKLSFITYEPNSGASWATPGSWSRSGPVPGTLVNALAYSPDYDRSTGYYQGSGSDRPGWPLWSDGAEDVTLAHPGRYVADSASRDAELSGVPAFVPGVAEQFVSRYHDGNLAAYGGEEATAGVIGLQIEQNTYSFSEAGLDNTVILHYRIINVSNDTLYNCYVGTIADPDIGRNANNDHETFFSERPELSTAIIWSGYESGTQPGTLLMTVLESPAVDERGFIRHDRLTYDSSEQVNVGAFHQLTVDENPGTQAERYDIMSLPGYDGDNGAGDKRALLATRAFNMLPGDTARFAVAYTVLADLGAYTSAVEPVIASAAERVITLYREAPTSSVSRPAGAPSSGLSIGRLHPNPATRSATLDLHLERSAATTVRLVDRLGRVVPSRESRMMERGDHSVSLDLAGIDAGVYIVSVESGGSVKASTLVVAR